MAVWSNDPVTKRSPAVLKDREMISAKWPWEMLNRETLWVERRSSNRKPPFFTSAKKYHIHFPNSSVRTHWAIHNLDSSRNNRSVKRGNYAAHTHTTHTHTHTPHTHTHTHTHCSAMCCGEEKTSKRSVSSPLLWPQARFSHIHSSASDCIQYTKVQCMKYPINGRNDRFDDKSINKHAWMNCHSSLERNH